MWSGCPGGSAAAKSAISPAMFVKESSARGPERQHMAHGIIGDGAGSASAAVTDAAAGIALAVSGAMHCPGVALPLAAEAPHCDCPPLSFRK
jgi:hypothetical protein